MERDERKASPADAHRLPAGFNRAHAAQARPTAPEPKKDPAKLRAAKRAERARRAREKREARRTREHGRLPGWLKLLLGIVAAALLLVLGITLIFGQRGVYHQMPVILRAGEEAAETPGADGLAPQRMAEEEGFAPEGAGAFMPDTAEDVPAASGEEE